MAVSPLPPAPLALALLLGGLGCLFILLARHVLPRALSSVVPPWRARHTPTHLLVVLGSGGHTAEMFSMLRRTRLDCSQYTYRTYVVSSGDDFSARAAIRFEADHPGPQSSASYTIVTVPRARRVHQSYVTAPFSVLQCFYACLLVLCGRHPDQPPLPPLLASPYPDLVLTNGPATGVCVILAARLLRLYHSLVASFTPKNRLHVANSADRAAGNRLLMRDSCQLRTIFVESWARVTSLSLSGKLLLPFADRFLVQWPALEGKRAWKGMRPTEYVGTLVE
ncbi:oligosaccharide biosynthesis protein Alg14 like protein [Aspergillus steynii IBT 23096]|uniref:UDP-N-acetylglucosamine transferase subunit ALG14 n=1 Tax=Aspergillus steynii IBT 23096 TaxID=1392250 RepID=A0A2I2G245_9EURO|nr:oligosaccharide biosynthesis protein Alg14 like protein [Aspergillus steynii IBT 23096]PLB46937.1 oligosaccharide biosynthesis protein Alg14 like protein [Aspergillus steynii IBT 23096]